jgi:nucleoside-diphosphate-sugar epimerase
MVNILVLGGTGPTGIALIREALARGHTVVIFARSPSKIPEDISRNPSVIVVPGSLEHEEDIAKAFKHHTPDGGHLQIDAVVSALGPPVTKINPKGHPIARGYENVIKVANEYGVKRFIVLGTASIKDDADKFDIRFQSLVLG